MHREFWQREPLLLMLPSGHPETRKRRLSLAALRDGSFLSLQESHCPSRQIFTHGRTTGAAASAPAAPTSPSPPSQVAGSGTTPKATLSNSKAALEEDNWTWVMALLGVVE